MRRALACSTTISAIALCGTVAQAQTPTPAPTPPPAEKLIRPGVTVLGLNVGGLTRAQAAARLRETFGERMKKNVAVKVGDRSFSLTMERIGLRFDAEKTARRANIAGLNAAPQPDGTYPVDVPLWVSYKRTQVQAFATQVDRRVSRRARNATVRITLTRMERRHSRPGLSINGRNLRLAIQQTVVNPGAKRLLRLTREVVRPAVTADQLTKRYPTVLTIDRDRFKLRLFKNLELAKTYGIAVGMAGLDTPAGQYSIQNKAVNPAWHVPNSDWAGSLQGQVIPGGAPNNPLKARWLGIAAGVGIHGTAESWSIGTRASHGCIRMHVGDVIALYDRVPVGTPVLIR
jgi:lipoprotein-anchoring transpeptidase ErfK/SrfK